MNISYSIRDMDDCRWFRIFRRPRIYGQLHSQASQIRRNRDYLILTHCFSNSIKRCDIAGKSIQQRLSFLYRKPVQFKFINQTILSNHVNNTPILSNLWWVERYMRTVRILDINITTSRVLKNYVKRLI